MYNAQSVIIISTEDICKTLVCKITRRKEMAHPTGRGVWEFIKALH